MKNIGIYLESTESTGGVNRVSTIIANSLISMGYNVYMISRYKGTFGLFDTADSNIKYCEIFKNFHSKYFTILIENYRLTQIVKRNNIDILISTGSAFFAVASTIRVKHIVWDHVSFWHGNFVIGQMRKFAAKYADVIIVLTEDNKCAYEKSTRGKAKIIKINNPAVSEVHSKYSPEYKSVISLGYLGEQKGYDLLLEAWNLLPEELKRDWTLKIAGGDEGYMQILKKYIKSNNLSNVKLLGFRKDVELLLSTSSIYVMSSRWEGMPMVLLEAQSHGLPIVSFDCKTGPSEIITSESGILVPPEDYMALSTALKEVMMNNKIRCNMSLAALENVKRFSVSNIAAKWNDVITQL